MPGPSFVHARRVWGGLLILYVLLLATVLLQPVPTVASGTVGRVEGWLTDLGTPAELTVPGRVEMVLNAVIFTPVALLGALTWPRVPWANWVVYGFVASGLAELAQGVLLPARSAEFVDVVANTLGALGGAVLACILHRWSRQTDAER